MAYLGGQKRRYNREQLLTPYPVVFDYQNRSHHALLVNLSKSGAGMKSAEKSNPPQLAAGEELPFEVSVTFGVSVVWGRVAWASVQNESSRWGVEFLRLSTNPNDPLRRLLDTIEY